MVEFALVIPIVLILFVAIADFARVFAAGVVIEGAARDAAEIGALEYLANPPGDPATPSGQRLSTPAPNPGDTAYYRDIHVRAAEAACSEARNLPNTTYDPDAKACAEWPAVVVCVHDGADPICGEAPPGFSTGPPECAGLSSPPMTTAQSGTEQDRWVEVRLCYRFTPLLSVPLISFGDVYLQRVRAFAVACYFATGTADPCG